MLLLLLSLTISNITHYTGGYRGQKMKAWLGDLILNAAVARELMKKRSERQNIVTNHNVAVSNEFLYNRANSILNLPKHITDDEKYRKLSEHQIGTSELP